MPFDQKTAAIFGNEKLPPLGAELCDEGIDMGVIQWTGDVGAGEPEESGEEPGQFEVSKMPGDDDFRSFIEHEAKKFQAIIGRKMVAPIGAMDLAPRQSRLADEQRQMLPHAPTHQGDLLGGPIGIDCPQVGLDQLSAEGNHMGCERREKPRQPASAIGRQHLDHADCQTE